MCRSIGIESGQRYFDVVGASTVNMYFLGEMLIP